MFELFVVNGICGGTVFFLPDVPTVLGRSPESHVQVADPWISSMHALFERRGDALWVVDLDSRNGTFVGEERVHEARLAPGARLRFGRTGAELRVRSDTPDREGVLSDQRTILRFLKDFAADPAKAAGKPDAAPAPEASEALPTLQGLAAAPAQARRQAGVLNEIGRALLGAEGLEEAMRRLLRVLGGAVGAERSSVLLLDERGAPIPLVAEPPSRPPGLSETVLQAALRSRAGVLTLDARQDERFARSESVVAQGIQSCICAPIWADNRILGVILLERGIARPFTSEDLELATLAGFQAALAVERVRIEERARQSGEQRRRLAAALGPEGAEPILAAEPGERDPLEPVLRAEVAVVAALPVGVAELASVLPPVEAAARALALQRAVAGAAQARGAAVDLGLSGGVLAVLDLAQPFPDARERAHRCALDLLAAARALEEGQDLKLSVRVGVSCGPAFVGNFGPADLPELRAMGPAVDEAIARASAARPGELVDPDGWAP